MSNNIILIGFMGSGKTSIGREIANKTDTILLDTDRMIEVQLNMIVDEIFVRLGEDKFREQEVFLCNFLSKNVSNSVIATGGGTPSRTNLKALNMGKIFYLKAPLDHLIQRVKEDMDNKRPLFRKIRLIEDLYKFREPLYENAADFTIDAVNTISNIADIIINYSKGCK